MSASFREKTALLRSSLRKYRRLTLIGLLALVVVDLFEVAPPLLLKSAVDVATAGGPLAELREIALLYFAVAVVQAIGRYGWRMYLVRASMFAGRDVRSSFGAHLYALSSSFFDRRPIGDLMSLATTDVEAVRQALGPGLIVLGDALFYFLTVPVAMFWLSPKLTLISFLFLPVIPWLVLRNERLVHERYERVQESLSELSALTQEAFGGMRVTKGFAREDVQIRRFRAIAEEYVKRSLHLARVQTPFGPTLDFAMSLGMVILIFYGGSLVMEPSSAVTLGTFVAFQRYIQKMIWPMAAMGMALNIFQRSITSSGRLQEVFAARSDVADTPSAKHFAPAATRGAIEFRGLTFRFPGTSRDVLRNIHLRVEPGERVAFVGTVGSGKSALLSLLPRLYPVSPGQVFVDGVDIVDWPLRELRQQVGYVGQDVFLFSESVLENLAYGFMSGPVDTPVEEATQLACVHDDILGLHRSYATPVGERGVSLSGGQKQRLTIARAILRQPPILVLDDALSSVDVQTEERILAGLRARPGRNTEVIAAHRISTIRDADRIVVLERGEIAQIGKHARLIAERGSIYARFYEQQRLREDLEAYSASLESGGPTL